MLPKFPFFQSLTDTSPKWHHHTRIQGTRWIEPPWTCAWPWQAIVEKLWNYMGKTQTLLCLWWAEPQQRWGGYHSNNTRRQGRFIEKQTITFGSAAPARSHDVINSVRRRGNGEKSLSYASAPLKDTDWYAIYTQMPFKPSIMKTVNHVEWTVFKQGTTSTGVLHLVILET